MNNQELKDAVKGAKTNPIGITKVVLDVVETTSNGERRIVDPNNPLALLLEGIGSTTSALMDEHQIAVRRMYPSLIASDDDANRHTPDRLHGKRHWTPSKASFQIFLDKDEVEAAAVQVGSSSVKKVTIPKNTVLIANDLIFGIHNPIDILILDHGVVRVLWDSDNLNPDFPIDSNVLDYRLDNIRGYGRMIRIDVPVEQFILTTHLLPVNNRIGFKHKLSLTDRFHKVSIATDNTNGEWVPMNVSFSEDVYDVESPTAVVFVADNEITLSIPQIYFTKGLIGRTVRVLVYTTRGPMDLTLDTLSPEAYSAQWNDIDDIDDGRYTQPFRELRTLALRAVGDVTGGGAGLTYLEARELIVGGSDGEETNFDINQTALESNFTLSLINDTVTDRRYLITRPIDSPNADVLSTVHVARHSLRFEWPTDLAFGVVANDNNNVLMVTPDAVFKIVDGKLAFVTNAEAPALDNTDVIDYPEATVVSTLNSEEYLSTPFHYMLDKSVSPFETRCYYLDGPNIERRNFIETSEQTGLVTTVTAIDFVKDDNGYKVRFLVDIAGTITDDMDFQVQLGTKPADSLSDVFLTATVTKDNEGEVVLVDEMHHFEFDITSQHFVDALDRLAITGFGTNVNNNTVTRNINLTQLFDIYVIGSGSAFSNTDNRLDTLVGGDLLPNDFTVLSHEQVTLTFGRRMYGIEGRSLTHDTDTVYQTYDADIPKLYTEAVYATDQDGVLDVSLDAEDNVVYTQLHDVGDPVLDGEGNPVLEHAIGEPVLDSNGAMIPMVSSYLGYESEMILMSSLYRFASSDSTKNFDSDLVNDITNVLDRDYLDFRAELHPQTELQYSPKATVGEVTVKADDDNLFVIKASIPFAVDLHVIEAVLLSDTAKEGLKRTIGRVIAEHLLKPTISITEIAEAIRATDPTTVKGCFVHPVTEHQLKVFTVLDDTRKLSIAATMTVDSNSTLLPQDDISVQFRKHR